MWVDTVVVDFGFPFRLNVWVLVVVTFPDFIRVV